MWPALSSGLFRIGRCRHDAASRDFGFGELAVPLLPQAFVCLVVKKPGGAQRFEKVLLQTRRRPVPRSFAPVTAQIQ